MEDRVIGGAPKKKGERVHLLTCIFYKTEPDTGESAYFPEEHPWNTVSILDLCNQYRYKLQAAGCYRSQCAAISIRYFL